MVKKAQSSTEFLATYGWALLIMFLVIAMLISSGVFNPSRFANEECTFQPNLPCTQYYLAPSQGGTSLSFNITNTMGFPIAIMGYAAQIEGSFTDCFDGKCSQPVYLKQGDSAMLTISPLAVPNAFTQSDFAKIKTTLQFRNCHGQTEAACLSPASKIPSYYTSGRINLFPRGDIEAGGSSSPVACTPQEQACINGDAVVCAGEEGGPTHWSIKDPCTIQGLECYMDNGEAKCRSSTPAQDCAASLQNGLPAGKEGDKICYVSVGSPSSSYAECRSGSWASVACPNANDVCQQSTPTSIICSSGPQTYDCAPSLQSNLPGGNIGDKICYSTLSPTGPASSYAQCTAGGWAS
ncbi:MAG: hypothetical protein V1822_04120 [Candidatus Micrarchaeota archaeon]